MFNKELEEMKNAALLAQKVILEVYHEHFNVEIKSDNSPVTAADKGADELIRKYLHGKFPSYAFLTEESKDDGERLKNDYVFIVDPVDGTKDFVARNNEFTTNIALCYKHEIVAGVVNVPAMNIMYYALKGEGAFKVENNVITKIHVNDKLEDLTVLTSNFHTNDKERKLIEEHSDKIKHIKGLGSSIKACAIAEGKAEISYRMSNGTKEWDTAAFDIIVSEAGGFVVKPDLNKMTYNRENVHNEEGYVIVNRKENILL